MRVVQSVVINASAEQVWEVVGRGFPDIGAWASAVPRSEPTPTGDGRVCAVAGGVLTDHVVERLIAYDDTARSLMYEAQAGLPAVIAEARNTWTVQPLGDSRARVSVSAGVVLSDPWRAAAPALAVTLHAVGRRTLRELRHRVETGEPTPRKRRQLARASAQRGEAANGGMLLRSTMRANALFSALSGLALVGGAPALDAFFGLGPWLLAGTGAGLIGFAAFLRWSLAHAHRLPLGGRVAVAGDAAWIAGAALILARFPTVLTAPGRTVLAGVTVLVVGFGAAQAVGLRRIRRAATGTQPASARSNA